MKLPIVRYGDPILRAKGKRIERIDEPVRTLAFNMLETMHAANGVGLAATQIGIARKIAVIDCSNGEDPQAKIVLIQMEAPPNYGIAYTRRFRAVYAEVARKEKLPLLPFLLTGVAGIPRLNQPDGVHPNLAGERIVADNVWKSLKPIVALLDRGAKSG